MFSRDRRTVDKRGALGCGNQEVNFNYVFEADLQIKELDTLNTAEVLVLTAVLKTTNAAKFKKNTKDVLRMKSNFIYSLLHCPHFSHH